MFNLPHATVEWVHLQTGLPLRFLRGMSNRLSIVVVEKDRDRAMLIMESLRDAGDHDVFVISEETGLARRISERNPDVVLVDVSSPSRDMLEELTLASSPMDRPVAMFVDKSDDGLTKAAIEAGVSAYVVDGLRSDRIKPILDAAITRFHMFQRMRTELEATKRALEERKIIDRAKGLLMKARGIGEDEAYALLRKTAMDQGRKVVDVAEALVTAVGLLS
ncbi:putative transcriptional regulatory protein pdtaR [Actibacterium lipolyticum]|uniref:Putative transcriptional regulatory protein pdtaR n=2 Tax=Actibacterium lipolyticum TaxID=1524263 RepID=A0A238JJ34_9RHOB|nr:putative transcriptional regulatory protein pdtaR [Actibacterium lipolyticum]